MLVVLSKLSLRSGSMLFFLFLIRRTVGLTAVRLSDSFTVRLTVWLITDSELTVRLWRAQNKYSDHYYYHNRYSLRQGSISLTTNILYLTAISAIWKMNTSKTASKKKTGTKREFSQEKHGTVFFCWLRIILFTLKNIDIPLMALPSSKRQKKFSEKQRREVSRYVFLGCHIFWILFWIHLVLPK